MSKDNQVDVPSAPSAPSAPPVVKKAEEVLDAAVSEPSLDLYFDRDPRLLRDEDIDSIIIGLRAVRVRFTKKREERKEARDDADNE